MPTPKHGGTKHPPPTAAICRRTPVSSVAPWKLPRHSGLHRVGVRRLFSSPSPCLTPQSSAALHPSATRTRGPSDLPMVHDVDAREGDTVGTRVFGNLDSSGQSISDFAILRANPCYTNPVSHYIMGCALYGRFPSHRWWAFVGRRAYHPALMA